MADRWAVGYFKFGQFFNIFGDARTFSEESAAVEVRDEWQGILKETLCVRSISQDFDEWPKELGSILVYDWIGMESSITVSRDGLEIELMNDSYFVKWTDLGRALENNPDLLKNITRKEG